MFANTQQSERLFLRYLPQIQPDDEPMAALQVTTTKASAVSRYLLYCKDGIVALSPLMAPTSKDLIAPLGSLNRAIPFIIRPPPNPSLQILTGSVRMIYLYGHV